MKRLIPIILSLCLLAGCAAEFPGKTPAATEPPTETQVPTAAPTDTPTEMPTEPPTDAPTEPPLPAGWFEEGGQRYYRMRDGSLATGAVVIDGVTRHFSSTGAYVVVVNPWNAVPEDYTMQLQALPSSVSTAGCYVDSSCYDAMIRMINDCNAKSGATVCVVSAYRSVQLQTENFNRKVNSYLSAGYDYDTAYTEASSIIAVPGTSEHHLGLAADIIDTRNWGLVEEQENLSGQRWLMEHCHEYGFILRYPKGSREVTGIIYEPWHYRYVGIELAQELHELNITLEAYMANLTHGT